MIRERITAKAGVEQIVTNRPSSSGLNKSKLFPRATTTSCALGAEKLPIHRREKNEKRARESIIIIIHRYYNSILSHLFYFLNLPYTAILIEVGG